MNDRVLDLKQWLSLLGGELDYDYGTTEQPMGMLALSVPETALVLMTVSRELAHPTLAG